MSNQIERDQGRVSVRLVLGKRENGQFDLVRTDHLQTIGLMVIMPMSYSRVVSVALILWGVSPVLRNGFGI